MLARERQGGASKAQRERENETIKKISFCALCIHEGDIIETIFYVYKYHIHIVGTYKILFCRFADILSDCIFLIFPATVALQSRRAITVAITCTLDLSYPP